MAKHADLTSIHPFAYVQATDPGAVGANKAWIDTSVTPPLIRLRNAANTAWLAVSGSGGGTPATNAGALLMAWSNFR